MFGIVVETFPPNASAMRGRLWSTVADRTWARNAWTGTGVIAFMPRSTCDDAIVCETAGTPSALMLAASMEVTSAATIVTTTAPSARSIRRIPTLLIRDWMRCPRDEPP
jgi:hypothetical protein